jgi:hypothetical protein
MTDIIKRLGSMRLSDEDYKIVADAIDEIERLRDALSFYASFAKVPPQMNVAIYYIDNGRIAAAALKEGE